MFRNIFYVVFVCFFGLSTFVGYLMPNQFSYKQIVLLKTNQFSISTQWNCLKNFYFEQLGLVKQFYFKQLSFV